MKRRKVGKAGLKPARGQVAVKRARPARASRKAEIPASSTKPAGEGTGLGLSLSHDIVVKQHAGSIEVDTRPGEFTEFRIVLPRGAAAVALTGGNE